MKCKCGNDEFRTYQVYYLNVITDGNGEFLRNDSDDEGTVYEGCEKPAYPITCTKCNESYQCSYDLEVLPINGGDYDE